MEENENIKKIKQGFTKFGLGNFKGFRDIQEIELAPITLVFGQNSGGKTSLLQSILSLSQSFYEIEKGKFQLSGNKSCGLLQVKSNDQLCLGVNTSNMNLAIKNCRNTNARLSSRFK